MKQIQIAKPGGLANLKLMEVSPTSAVAASGTALVEGSSTLSLFGL